MYNLTYLQAILIYVKDRQTGYIHIVGTDQHDRLYLDDSGNIQYMNLQSYSNNRMADLVSNFDMDLKDVKKAIDDLKREIKAYEYQLY